MSSIKTFKGLIIAGLFGLSSLLTGCGGGGAGGDAAAGGAVVDPPLAATASVSGTAATGAPLAVGTVITIKDAENRTVNVTGNTVGANGLFTLSIANPTTYAAPFIVRADPPGGVVGDEHYSILFGPLEDSRIYHVNITPITSLILFEATKKSLATVFSAPQTYLPGLTDVQLNQARDNVVGQFPALAGVDNQDFIGQIFSAADGDPYDDAMDAIDFVTLSFTGDTPTLKDGNGISLNYNANVPLFPIASIVVSAGSSTQVANGASFNAISATVTNTQGQLVKNIAINFETTAGTLWTTNDPLTANASTTAITDDNGVARLFLRTLTLNGTPTLIGTATVTAASSDNTAQGSTSVTFVPGAPAVIGLSAQPSEVGPGGTTTLTAVVTDINGNLVANNENVTFSVTTPGGALGGTFSGAPIVNRTTTNGVITLTYTAGALAGTESIVATATNGSTRTLPITVAVNPNSISSLALSSSAAAIPADNSSTVNLIATARNSSGAGVPGAVVSFTRSAGTLSAATAITNASGVATVTLKSGSVALTALASASVNGFTATTNVSFGAGAASVFAVNAAPSSVKPGGSSNLTIAVLDINGNAVSNEPVSLSFTARGSGTPSLSATNGTTNANGLLLVTYTAGANPGNDTIIARTSNDIPATVTIGVSSGNIVIGSIETTATNGSIPVTTGETIIRALVRDNAGLVVPGATVNFATSAGSLNGALATSATTDANGIATVTLTAGAQVLSARVEATINGFADATSVSFTAGAPNAVSVSAAPNAVNPGDSSTISVLVVDAAQNPVVGETVTFSITARASGLPTLAVVSAVTNASGLASVTYTAGANNGVDTVNARTSNGNTGAVNINVNASTTVVGNITLLSGATTLPAGGVTAATLRATVTTSTGAPASGITVIFSTTGGGLSVASAITNASGIAETRLTSPNRTGTVTVIAEASGFLASQDVAIVAANAATMALSGSPASVNAGGISALTAIVLDANDNPVVGQTVTFTITPPNNTNGSLAPLTATTSANGIATAVYTGGTTLGTDTIRAALVGGLETTTTVRVTGSSVTDLSIGTSRTTVKTDGSEIAVITVTALTSQNVVVPGVTVSFAASGGQLSAAQAVTDANGQARVNLSAGALDKSNRIATVTASAAGVTDVQIPVRIVDSTVALLVTNSTLTAGGTSVTATVTARDASGLGVFNVPVTLSQAGSGSVSIVAATGNTDVNGQFTTTLTGLTPGSVTLAANALAASASQVLTVTPGSTFAIRAPLDDPESLSTAGALNFTVNAPTQSSVRFATTLGVWAGPDRFGVACASICEKAVGGGGTASATLSSSNAGTADIQVDGLDAGGNVNATDTHRVFVSAVTSSSISLQGSVSNVSPSTGGTQNTVQLIATVRDALGQPVGGVPVAFSILNTSSGGESISPVVKPSSDGTNSTDPLGQARTTFTSGSLPSGQSSASIQVQATALDSGASATFNIVVGGTAGSMAIGQATRIEPTSTTQYTFPMSVLVADSNGNPAPAGTVVSLSVWPVAYSTGIRSAATCAALIDDADPLIDSSIPPDGNSTNDADATYLNEDVNENLILDAGDTDNVGIGGNGDGSLTPPNSSAGTLPSAVATNASGVANFGLVYLKQYADWVVVRLRASTLVQGTETTSSLVFRLPASREDATPCTLPNSPFFHP